MLHAAAVLHHLLGLRFGHPVHLFQVISSTNDHAKRLAEAGAPEGLLVIAESQTAGRGRAGRKWLTPPGAGLAFSLVLRPAPLNLPPERTARLTMLAGLAVCESIEQVAGVRARLKWPNDILIAGRKTGGILAEAALQSGRVNYVVLGFGLNVSAAPLPEEVDFPATSLQAEAGRDVDRLILLRAILANMEARYPTLTEPELDREWRARLTMLEEPVVIQTLEGERRGRIEGVEADGALVVHLDTGETLRMLAGDVRLRPVR